MNFTIMMIEVFLNNYRILKWVKNKPSVLSSVKNFTFLAGFVWLSLIPMICQALDVIYLISGIVGQMAILVIGAYLNNGRMQWKEDRVMASN